jgi:ATP-binding cassette, subfamily B, bacterial
MNVKSFPHYNQLDSMDCGPTCLRMIAAHYGKEYSLPLLREKSYIDRAGESMKGISEAAESIGFRTLAHFDFLALWYVLLRSFQVPSRNHQR